MSIKKLLFFIPLTIIIFLIAGCSSSDSTVDQNIIGEFDNAPSWVSTKQMENKISEIGKASTKSKNFAQKRDSAITNAQESLSKKLRIKVLNIFKSIKDINLDATEYEMKVSTATNNIIESASKNSKIMKLWQSNSKTIYVLVSADIQKLKDSIEKSTKVIFKDMPSVSSNYSLKLEQGNIDIELLK